MDYRKHIHLIDEDNNNEEYDFDIILNRAMAFNALKLFPKLAEVIINGVGRSNGENKESEENNEVKTERQLILERVINGEVEDIFAVDDNMPKLIIELFPKMLDSGEIRIGDRGEILSIINDLVYDDNFIQGMTDFFMQALAQTGNTPKKKVKFKIM